MRIAITALTMLTAAVLPAAATELSERVAPCLACHGEKGQSETPAVPSLGDRPEPRWVPPDPPVKKGSSQYQVPVE